VIQVRRKRELPPDAPNRFVPGDLVRHRKYGYRGLVVALDLTCLASEDWYRSNRSQPTREQPWYHVLVHGAEHTTYAAEENLTEEWEAEPIRNPLVERFFSAFTGDGYLRNDVPWSS